MNLLAKLQEQDARIAALEAAYNDLSAKHNTLVIESGKRLTVLESAALELRNAHTGLAGAHNTLVAVLDEAVEEARSEGDDHIRLIKEALGPQKPRPKRAN